MTAPVIEATGLRRVFHVGGEEVRALDGVDLRVERGELLALVGTSGSGKSTLLNLLGCLDRPDAGSYRLNGAEVATLGDEALARVRNRDLGFVFQAFNLLPRLRADENVALPLRYAGWPEPKRLERARVLLDRVGLGGRAGHLPSQLSGGQMQRVAVARALAADPALILADEPTGNLDSRSSEDILKLFQELHGEGRTIVIVTHDPHVAGTAQRQVRVADGKIVADVRA